MKNKTEEKIHTKKIDIFCFYFNYQFHKITDMYSNTKKHLNHQSQDKAHQINQKISNFYA